MTDEIAAFTRAIVDYPRDRLTRLVFADFLEETGDPNHVARAHLIRAQVALDDPDTDADEYDRLKAMEGRLLDLFQQTWDLELPVWLTEEGGTTVEYRGGFVERVSLSLSIFVRRAVELFAAVPLRSLTFPADHPVRFPRDLADRLTALPRLANIEELKFGSHSGMLTDFAPSEGGDREPPPWLVALLTVPTLSGLRVLDVSENRITDEWLVAFVSGLPAAAFADTLETLDLTYCVQVTDAGGNALATARSLENLKRLVLKEVPLTGPTRTMLRRRFGDRVAL